MNHCSYVLLTLFKLCARVVICYTYMNVAQNSFEKRAWVGHMVSHMPNGLAVRG